jgi:hypothetical protein
MIIPFPLCEEQDLQDHRPADWIVHSPSVKAVPFGALAEPVARPL